MKRSNAARGIFWLTVTLAIGFLMQAESGDRRTSMPQIKSAPPGAIGYQHDFRCDGWAGLLVFAEHGQHLGW